jgi:hypothetical protein
MGVKTVSRSNGILIVFGNRVLRRVFEHNKEYDERLEKLHNEELHHLCCSSNIIRAINSRTKRCANEKYNK